MDVKAFFFYLFAALTLISGFRVVTARNPVHSALFLILTSQARAMLADVETVILDEVHAIAGTTPRRLLDELREEDCEIAGV